MITINGEKEIEVASGETLLTTLGAQKIFLPSACGGGGTCIQCECHVNSGGGEALPTEVPHFTRKELKSGARLACQVKVKQDMNISIPQLVQIQGTPLAQQQRVYEGMQFAVIW